MQIKKVLYYLLLPIMYIIAFLSLLFEFFSYRLYFLIEDFEEFFKGKELERNKIP